MVEAGESNLGGGTGSTQGLAGLVDGDAEAGLSEDDGCGEAIGSGADDVCGLVDDVLSTQEYQALKMPLSRAWCEGWTNGRDGVSSKPMKSANG